MSSAASFEDEDVIWNNRIANAIYELLPRHNNVIFCGGATALESRSMNDIFDSDVVLDIEAKEVLSRRAKLDNFIVCLLNHSCMVMTSKKGKILHC